MIRKCQPFRTNWIPLLVNDRLVKGPCRCCYGESDGEDDCDGDADDRVTVVMTVMMVIGIERTKL